MDNNNKPNELYFSDLIARLWKNRKSLIICACCGAVFGFLMALGTPPQYTANMSFAPETQQKFGAGVSSIASMMGVNIDNSVDAISVEMFPDVLVSTPFVYNLFDIPVVTKDGKLETTLLDYMQNHQKKSWLSHVINAPFKLLELILGEESSDTTEVKLNNLPAKTRRVIRYFRENIKIEMDKKTGKTTISLTMQDPLIAATVLEVIVSDLKEYMCDYRSSKDRQDVENLTLICADRQQDYYDAQKKYADFVDSNFALTKYSAQSEQMKLQQEMNLAYQVYSQVATQLELARIKEQQAKPVFVILEPVSIPLYKSSPGKIQYTILFAFLAAFLAVVWVLFGRNFYNEVKDLI